MLLTTAYSSMFMRVKLETEEKQIEREIAEILRKLRLFLSGNGCSRVDVLFDSSLNSFLVFERREEFLELLLIVLNFDIIILLGVNYEASESFCHK